MSEFYCSLLTHYLIPHIGKCAVDGLTVWWSDLRVILLLCILGGSTGVLLVADMGEICEDVSESFVWQK